VCISQKKVKAGRLGCYVLLKLCLGHSKAERATELLNIFSSETSEIQTTEYISRFEILKIHQAF
jgi:hypothetical protein